MNARAMLAIVRKDLKVVRQNKNVVTPIIIIAVVFYVVFPWVIGQAPMMVKGFGGNLTSLESYMAKLPAGMLQEYAGLTINQQMVMYAMTYMLLPFFLMLPLMVASMIAADSFAGEKERKT